MFNNKIFPIEQNTYLTYWLSFFIAVMSCTLEEIALASIKVPNHNLYRLVQPVKS